MENQIIKIIIQTNYKAIIINKIKAQRKKEFFKNS